MYSMGMLLLSHQAFPNQPSSPTSFAAMKSSSKKQLSIMMHAETGKLLELREKLRKEMERISVEFISSRYSEVESYLDRILDMKDIYQDEIENYVDNNFEFVENTLVVEKWTQEVKDIADLVYKHADMIRTEALKVSADVLPKKLTEAKNVSNSEKGSVNNWLSNLMKKHGIGLQLRGVSSRTNSHLEESDKIMKSKQAKEESVLHVKVKDKPQHISERGLVVADQANLYQDSDSNLETTGHKHILKATDEVQGDKAGDGNPADPVDQYMASDGGLDQTVLQQDGDCSIVSTDKADIDQLRDGELTTARQAIIYQASDGDNHDGVADTSKALLHKNGVCDQATTNHAVQAVGEGVLAGHADRYNQEPSDKACHTDLYEGNDGILDTSAGQPALHKSTTCGLVFKVGLAVAGRATMHQAGDDVLETSAKAIHYQATGHATFFQASDSGQPDASYSAFDNASEKVLVGHTAMYQARDGVLAQAVLHNGSDGYTANHPTLYQARLWLTKSS